MKNYRTIYCRKKVGGYPQPLVQKTILPPLSEIRSIAILLPMEKGNRPIPNTLRLHRKTMGYTQRQVATLIGLHDSVPVSLWEKGEKLPSTTNLIKLSLIYRTYPNELYSDVFNSFREELKEREFKQFISN